MVPIIIFVVFLVFTVASLYFFVHGQATKIQDAQELLALTQPVDLEAFRNLMDDEEDIFLRNELDPVQYSQAKKKKNRVILAYIRSLAHNAALLIQLGEAARNSPDPEQQAAGAKLVNAALEMRVLSLTAMVKLRFAILFPPSQFGVTSLTESYAQLVTSAGSLFRLQSPTFTSRLLAAL